MLLQLGQRSSERDVWLWVPTVTGHNQASPWSTPLTLSHWRECNELHFISSLPPPGGMQLVSGSADFIHHFPPMSAVGARQHPQQGPLLDPSSGGERNGGGNGSDSGRPSTGLLWPRGIRLEAIG